MRKFSPEFIGFNTERFEDILRCEKKIRQPTICGVGTNLAEAVNNAYEKMVNFASKGRYQFILPEGDFIAVNNGALIYIYTGVRFYKVSNSFPSFT